MPPRDRSQGERGLRTLGRAMSTGFKAGRSRDAKLLRSICECQLPQSLEATRYLGSNEPLRVNANEGDEFGHGVFHNGDCSSLGKQFPCL